MLILLDFHKYVVYIVIVLHKCGYKIWFW